MKTILTALLIFVVITAKCQTSGVVIDDIKKSISVNKTAYSSSFYKGKSYMFSLAIGINNEGMVDTVVHSNSSLFKTALVNFNDIVRSLKQKKNSFLQHRNKILFVLVSIRRDEDKTIENSNEQTGDWMSLAKELRTIQSNRKLVILDPVMLYF